MLTCLLKIHQNHIQEFGLMMMLTTTLELFQVKQTEDMHQNYQKNSLLVIIFFQVIELPFQETRLAMVKKTILQDSLKLPYLNHKNHTQEVHGVVMVSITILELLKDKPIETTVQNFLRNTSKVTILFQAIELQSQETKLAMDLKTTFQDLLKQKNHIQEFGLMMM